MDIVIDKKTNAQPFWIVKKVTPRDNYILELSFADGKTKLFDMKPYLDWKIFEPLKNPAFFNQAHTNGTTVVWNDQIDIAPETLYEKSTT